MATPFTFEIVTPDKMLFESEEVTYVGFRSLSGNLGIKAKHQPLIAALDVAPLKIEFADGSTKQFAVVGGFLEMDGTRCTILATVAEPEDEIDHARAQAAKERAEKRIASKSAEVDMQRANAALKRALLRLKVSK